MELLNLDTLVTVERKVTLKGEEYTIAQQTIGMVLDAISTTKGSQKDPDKMFVQMAKTAKRILPDCPNDVIEGMSVKQLTALIEFATAGEKELIENSEAEEVDAEGK